VSIFVDFDQTLMLMQAVEVDGNKIIGCPPQAEDGNTL